VPPRDPVPPPPTSSNALSGRVHGRHTPKTLHGAVAARSPEREKKLRIAVRGTLIVPREWSTALVLRFHGVRMLELCSETDWSPKRAVAAGRRHVAQSAGKTRDAVRLLVIFLFADPRGDGGQRGHVGLDRWNCGTNLRQASRRRDRCNARGSWVPGPQGQSDRESQARSATGKARLRLDR